jgi:hypothetical protein
MRNVKTVRMMPKPLRYARTAVVVLVLGALAIGGCGTDDGSAGDVTASARATDTTDRESMTGDDFCSQITAVVEGIGAAYRNDVLDMVAFEDTLVMMEEVDPPSPPGRPPTAWASQRPWLGR